MEPLQLSNPQLVADWLGDEQAPSNDIISALNSARALVTKKVNPDRFDTPDGVLPAPLHRWATMEAARLVRRRDSIYGADVFSLGGDAGGVLVHDPTLAELVAPYLKAPVGGATVTP